MSAVFNRDRTVAVDPDYCWQPMGTCPLGVKVQLLGGGGVWPLRARRQLLAGLGAAAQARAKCTK